MVEPWIAFCDRRGSEYVIIVKAEHEKDIADKGEHIVMPQDDGVLHLVYSHRGHNLTQGFVIFYYRIVEG